MNATSSILIKAPIGEVCKVLLDPIEYRLTDPRLTQLSILESDKRHARLRVRGYTFSAWLESAAVARVSFDHPGRLDYEVEPKTLSFPARLVVRRFMGSLVLDSIDAGTQVIRNEVITLQANPLGFLAARYGGGWLQKYLDEIAMPRLKQVIDARHSRG